MNRRKFTLLALLLLATIAAAPAHAQRSAHDYALAGLYQSYAAGQKLEIPRVVRLRAAVQRAEQAKRTAAPVSEFWAAQPVSAEFIPAFAPPPQARADSPALRTLRGIVQSHAPPATL